MAVGRIQGLYNDPRFAALQGTLTALAVKNGATALIGAAGQDINVPLFLSRLPAGGVVPTRAQLVEALNAGLNINLVAGGGQYDDALDAVLGAMNDVTVRANKVLAPLYSDPRFATLQVTLRALAAQNDAAALIAAGRDIDVAAFLAALPQGGVVPDRGQLISALNAGLGFGAGAGLQVAPAGQAYGGHLDAVVIAMNNVTVRANKVLAPLYSDPRFAALQAELRALAAHNGAAALIAAGRDIDVPLFLSRLPAGGGVPNQGQLIVALNAGLGLAVGAGFQAGQTYANDLNNVLGAMDNTVRANKILAPLYSDPRFAALQGRLTALAAHNGAAALIAAGRDINVAAFLAALPQGGAAPTQVQLVAALNAGLGVNLQAGQGYDAELNNVVIAMDNTVRANKVLAPLYSDPRFAALQGRLTALAAHNGAAALIAAGRDINVAAFLAALPQGGVVPDRGQLIIALNAGLGVNLQAGQGYDVHLDAVFGAMNVTVRANKVLAPLYSDPRFAVLQGTLTALAANAAALIATAGRDINVAAFLAALPQGGVVPDRGQLIIALNAGLGVNLQAGQGYDVHLDAVFGAMNNTVRANKVLAPLYSDPRFAALQGTLTALAAHNDAAALIVAGQDINVPLFLSRLPAGGGVPNQGQLIVALNAGLGLAVGTGFQAGRAYANDLNNVLGAMDNTVRANKVLAPLYSDPRFAPLQTSLNALAATPVVANLIVAATQNIDITAFLRALPQDTSVALTEGLIAKALDAGLGIIPPNNIESLAGAGGAGVAPLLNVAHATTPDIRRLARLANVISPNVGDGIMAAVGLIQQALPDQTWRNFKKWLGENIIATEPLTQSEVNNLHQRITAALALIDSSHKLYDPLKAALKSLSVPNNLQTSINIRTGSDQQLNQPLTSAQWNKMIQSLGNVEHAIVLLNNAANTFTSSRTPSAFLLKAQNYKQKASRITLMASEDPVKLESIQNKSLSYIDELNIIEAKLNEQKRATTEPFKLHNIDQNITVVKAAKKEFEEIINFIIKERNTPEADKKAFVSGGTHVAKVTIVDLGNHTAKAIMGDVNTAPVALPSIANPLDTVQLNVAGGLPLNVGVRAGNCTTSRLQPGQGRMIEAQYLQKQPTIGAAIPPLTVNMLQGVIENEYKCMLNNLTNDQINNLTDDGLNHLAMDIVKNYLSLLPPDKKNCAMIIGLDTPPKLVERIVLYCQVGPYKVTPDYAPSQLPEHGMVDRLKGETREKIRARMVGFVRDHEPTKIQNQLLNRYLKGGSTTLSKDSITGEVQRRPGKPF